MSKATISDIKKTYLENEINFEKLRILIIKEFDELLENKGVKLGFPIQSRVKSLESIIEKQESKRFTIKDSLLELQDIIGFRIVLLFKRDVEIVSKLIEENLSVISSYDPIDKLNYDQFGYSSKHYIVQIPNSWTNVPTNKNLDKFKIEIQIRTLSQHNWAETSNFLQYKNESNVPKEILRTIGRVSALLETVDLELERTLQEREQYISLITKNIEDNQELNVDVLKTIFSKFLPEEIHQDYELYSELLEELYTFNIFKVEDLIKLMRNNIRFNGNDIKFRKGTSNKWITYDTLIVDSAAAVIIHMLSHFDEDKWIASFDHNKI